MGREKGRKKGQRQETRTEGGRGSGERDGKEEGRMERAPPNAKSWIRACETPCSGVQGLFLVGASAVVLYLR